MSIKCMTRVWENSSEKGSALLLLLAIADCAHDDGYAWPGIQYLAKKTRLSKGSVIRLTKRLEECGDLFVIHSRRKGNKYIVKAGLTGEELEASKQANLPVSTKLISTKLVLLKSQVDTSEVPHVVHEPSLNVNESLSVDAGASTSVAKKPKRKNRMLPTTPQAKMMFERVGENQRAKGRRGTTQFPTLECKKKFDAAVIVLDGEFEAALTKALEQGITRITGITNYIAKWAENMRKSQQPNHIEVKA